MNENGISIIVAIFIMLVLSVTIATVAALVATSGDVAINYWESLEAFYIAEAGLARARVRLSPVGDWAFEKDHKEKDVSIGAGTFTVKTEYDKKTDTVTITSTGYVPDSSDWRAKREVVEENIPPPSGGITATASSESWWHPAGHAIDMDLETYWQAWLWPLPHWLRLTFISMVAFDGVIFYQDTVNIAEFHIEYYDGTDFVPVNNPVIDGPTGPNNKITVTFDQVESDQVQLVVDRTVRWWARPTISEFEVYLGGERVGLEGGTLSKGTYKEVY